MRKSHARTRARLWGAGAASALTVVSGLVAAAPAYALEAATSTLPASGPASGTINVTLTNMLAGVTAPLAYFSTGTTCGDTYSVNAANLLATVAKVSDNEARVTIPNTLSLGTDGVARKYTLCIYASSTSGAAGKAQTTYTVTPVGTLSPNNGPSGGGNVVTYTAPAGSAPFSGTPYAAMAPANSGCPNGYPSGSALYPTGSMRVVTTINKQTTSQATVTVPYTVSGNPPAPGSVAPPATGYTVCFYSANSGPDTLTAQSANGGYTVTLPTTTLNQTVGGDYAAVPRPSLTISSPAAFLTGVTAPAVVFRGTECPAVFPSGLAAGTEYNLGRKLTNNKVAVPLPSVVVEASGTFNVCTYSSTNTSSGVLLGAATYTPVSVPRVTAISPKAGSPLGGNLVTITGTNLPTSPGSITATLGGTQLQDITPINANTFTAVTPPHTQGLTSLVIGTSAGSSTLASAYTFINSISVKPNTAPNTARAVDLEVTGTGFKALNFTDTPNQDAKVYLTHGSYSGAGAAAATAGQPRLSANQVAACGNVLVINDTELVCTMDLTAALDVAGAKKYNGYTASAVVTATEDSAVVTVTGGTGNFTKGDIGEPVTVTTAGGTNGATFPAGTTVVDVLDKNTLVLSAAAITGSDDDVDIEVGDTRTIVTTSVTTTAGVTTAVAAANTFSAADIGSYVSVPTGGGSLTNGTSTIITSVNATGTTATLSGPVTGTITGLDISSGNAVPPGAYNIVAVSNASPAAGVNPGVSLSSSGSTFTVANY